MLFGNRYRLRILETAFCRCVLEAVPRVPWDRVVPGKNE